MISARERVVSIVLALRPFEPFDEDAAWRVLNRVSARLWVICTWMVDPEEVGCAQDGIPEVDLLWLREIPRSKLTPCERAFDVPAKSIIDIDGEFSSSLVLSAYYLKNGNLLARVLPHLASLGIPEISDMLVAIGIVGWITTTPDSITAYCSLNALLGRLLNPQDESVLQKALSRLAERESALRQTRARITLAMRGATLEDGLETLNLRRADVYKRIVEGPFRQYAWFMHCLEINVSSAPPMLGRLNAALAASAGWLSNISQLAILIEIRNGEAHEDLQWDGVHEVFRVAGLIVDPSRVSLAAVTADAFVRGCEAAVACYRALSVEHQALAPMPEEPGRLEPWRRALAFFGTNGISVDRFDFNSKIAKVTCKDFSGPDINPGFQALLCCASLLPHVERFELLVSGCSEPLISVSAAALRTTLPVWRMALQYFTSMPFSTFLPANFTARMEHEPPSVALRSAAWIVVDDVLDALDSSPSEWFESDLELFLRRLELAGEAVAQTLYIHGSWSRTRLIGVGKEIVAASSAVGRFQLPMHVESLERLDSIRRFRDWFESWGPVDRMPGVIMPIRPSGPQDHRPTLQETTSDLRWRTI